MNKTLMKTLFHKRWALSLGQVMLISSFLTLGMLNFMAEGAMSQQSPFYCSQLGGEWHTFKRYPRVVNGLKGYPFLTWRTERLGIHPYDRCRQVTDRFNTFQAQGLLNTLRSGEHRGYPVVCVGWCADGRILFTVEWGRNAADALATLRAIVDNGFGAGRLYNTVDVETDPSTGRKYIVTPDNDRILIYEPTDDGNGVLYFQEMLCQIDPYLRECYR